MQPHTVYERFKYLEVYKSRNEQILNGDTVNIDIRYLVTSLQNHVVATTLIIIII